MTDKDFDPQITTLLPKDLQSSKVTVLDEAKITHYSPNQVKIQTNTTAGEVLVLADKYEDGWKASVDGKITPFSPVNLIFRAVKIPTGPHQIVFTYWPKPFDPGLKISLFTFALATLITVIH